MVGYWGGGVRRRRDNDRGGVIVRKSYDQAAIEEHIID